MKKNQIVFKVVYDGASLTGSLRLYYRIGKTTKPRIGKILVFDSLKMAKRFANLVFLSNGGAIFVGKCTNAKRIKKLGSFETDFETFWKEYNSKKGHLVSTNPAPLGTLGCDSFKPTRRIK